jgi:hypothetical protein
MDDRISLVEPIRSAAAVNSEPETYYGRVGT